ncbi:hypothetical protein TWF192_009978 [Orbilia oligospora]|uniref:Uncharacterized protein n=1 Tax=Orbilia oligospora TaxID=2813651 RepID=A0A6G1LZC3_ORBOL|nr:hypothetical protein TWF191_002972 [Orbilia oligospora]KAF3210502.1 hypothetical protein TWF679_006706 [Orbilia oligospora]KAF3239510.1 hypothetical protein TWF192_009978 [Orbilia oligospora]
MENLAQKYIYTLMSRSIPHDSGGATTRNALVDLQDSFKFSLAAFLLKTPGFLSAGGFLLEPFGSVFSHHLSFIDVYGYYPREHPLRRIGCRHKATLLQASIFNCPEAQEHCRRHITRKRH